MRGCLVAAVFCFVAPLFAGMPAATPDTADEHFARAGKLGQEGKLAQAEAEYQAGLKLRPNDTQACNNLGVLYFQQRKLPQAIAAFERARQLDVHNAEVAFNLGLALYQSGKARRAIGYLEDALRGGAHADETHYLLGVCWFELKHWRRSATELELDRKSVV